MSPIYSDAGIFGNTEAGLYVYAKKHARTCDFSSSAGHSSIPPYSLLTAIGENKPRFWRASRAARDERSTGHFPSHTRLSNLKSSRSQAYSSVTLWVRAKGLLVRR